MLVWSTLNSPSFQTTDASRSRKTRGCPLQIIFVALRWGCYLFYFFTVSGVQMIWMSSDSLKWKFLQYSSNEHDFNNRSFEKLQPKICRTLASTITPAGHFTYTSMAPAESKVFHDMVTPPVICICIRLIAVVFPMRFFLHTASNDRIGLKK